MEYLLRYPQDLTGQNPDNLIKGETHELKDMRFRAIAPLQGAFYGDTVKIYDLIKGRELIRNKDFVTAEVLIDKTTLTGKPVNGIILVINRQVSKSVSVDYQCVGGDDTKNNQSIENLLKVEHDNVVSYNYLDMNKKPDSFKPTFHKHPVAEIYGFEYVVYLLEAIRNSIIWKKLDLTRELIHRVDNEINAIIETSINNADEALNKFLADYRHNFRKENFGLNLIKNLRPSNQSEGTAIAAGQSVDLVHEAYINMETLSYFKTELYSFLLSRSKTGVGYEHGIVVVPTKEYLSDAPNGTRFLINSYDVATKLNQPLDISVFPDLKAVRTKFSIYKVSNHPKGRGGVFMATNMITAMTYIGKITEHSGGLLVEWKALQLAQITDVNLLELVNHLGDSTNPHQDKKEDVGFDLLENLPIATKEDVLAQLSTRKYLTADNLQLYMKGFMAGQVDTNIIKPDPAINVMKRFDIVFSGCGDVGGDSISSGPVSCDIEEVDLSFNVFTQRPKYRNARRLANNPELKDFNPVIYEGYTKLLGTTLSTEHTTRSGIKLINLPEVLTVNQTWNFGTLYQGFRSGVTNYETTDPYYDTHLVIRGARTRPNINGALEVHYVKSYDELLKEYHNSQGIADEFEFPMKKGDFLVRFRAFNRPTEGATENSILDFEKKEQIVKIEIFSTGYTFFVDLRSAVYVDYNFVTLPEKNSPKVIPSIHYPKATDDWFKNTKEISKAGLLSSVIIGKAKLGDKSIDIEPDANLGINTLIENFRDQPRRAGYVNGTLGMSVIKLNNDGTNGVKYPEPIKSLPRDKFYNGILGQTIEDSLATVVFSDQVDLGKSINYNIHLDPFLDVTRVTRPIPYQDLVFSNPYASGNNSSGDTKYDAFMNYMRLGFNRLNAPDSISERLNSSKGTLTVTIKNPQNPSEEFTVDIKEGTQLNRDIFNSLYYNYITNTSRKKYWGQPTVALPYTELLEVPKRFVNNYRQQYRIVDADGIRHLESTKVESPDNVVVDIIEVGRLEYERILASDEEVQYNALFNNVAILKNWRFKGVKLVIDIDKYIAAEKYPLYPDFNIDRSVSMVEKDVTVYTVVGMSFTREEKYQKGLFDTSSFVLKAINDLANRKITIKVPDDLYQKTAEEIGKSMADEDIYRIGLDTFSTFNIMFGEYNPTNHMKFDKQTTTITINMAHVSIEQQAIFFKHHLKYIKWKFDIELVPTIITTTLYPVVNQDITYAKATFLRVKFNNFAKYFNTQESAKTDFEFSYATVRKMLYEVKINDSATTDFTFINANIRRVIGYRVLDAGNDYAKTDFEFKSVTVRKVVNYVIYKNYDIETTRSKFTLLGVNVKTVRIP